MRVLIAAGGTAGHINPALAIAGALKAADPAAEIHFAGRKEGMEYGLVTKAGYPFHHIEINGFQRKPTLKNVGRNVVALYHLALSGPRTAAILKEVRPDLVIGCGGYVSGPVVRAAAKKGIKTAIHEQNAFPGVTNKLLARNAAALHKGAVDAEKANQRSVVEIDTLEKINAELVATLKETVQIQKEGKANREAAQVKMRQIESDLKNALLENAQQM